ncbi:MAG TPA: YjjG family noncanonical pyrimidine nucleotidase [Gammaproteobacteria bacterium]|nr:YjjG family noncanonical pyrimidine nucleotidase [Gammaproteobacteria bacterium]
MHYKALLFDLDNTLIDFSFAEKQGLEKIYQLYFSQCISSHEFEHCFRTINKRLWHLVEQKHIAIDHLHPQRFQSLTQTIKVTVDAMEIAHTYAQALGEYSHWYPNIKATLLNLKKHYAIGIITNGITQVKQIQYAKLEIATFCDSFLVSEILGISKPDKAIFNLALQQLNVNANEALMIGDSLSSDYQGAINANLDFCWVNKPAQFLPLAYPAPKYMIQSVAELPDILTNQVKEHPLQGKIPINTCEPAIV